MDKMIAMQVLAGACGLVLMIVLVKSKMQFFLEFLLRAGVGMAAILWGNSVLLQHGIAISVGLNFWSLLTSGSLGIPGVVLLFVISAIQNL